MSSLKSDFEELRERIKHGREIGHASFEPIYYLIFSPLQILEVKRQTPAWVAKFRNEGWKVKIFSIAEQIEALLEKDPRKKLWMMADSKAPFDWYKTNQSIANALSAPGALQQRLEEFLTSLAGDKNSLLMVTDLEALHPYIRIGAIESQLQGKFQVPTIFLYPGVRTGKTRLRFLGFYPEDGNYRSMHIGG
jgi:hypothetical protein